MQNRQKLREKCSRCLYTSFLCLHEADIQKVGFGTVAFALFPLDSPDVLEDSNQTELRFI